MALPALGQREAGGGMAGISAVPDARGTHRGGGRHASRDRAPTFRSVWVSCMSRPSQAWPCACPSLSWAQVAPRRCSAISVSGSRNVGSVQSSPHCPPRLAEARTDHGVDYSPNSIRSASPKKQVSSSQARVTHAVPFSSSSSSQIIPPYYNTTRFPPTRWSIWELRLGDI